MVNSAHVQRISGYFVTFSEVIGYCYVTLLLTVLGIIGNIAMYFCLGGDASSVTKFQLNKPKPNYWTQWTKTTAGKDAKIVEVFKNILLSFNSLSSYSRTITKNKETVTEFFAKALVIDHLFFCLTLIPWPLMFFWGALYECEFWRTQGFAAFLSYLEFPLRNISSKISIGIILAMTVDRFIALKIPMKYRQYSTIPRGKATLIAIVIISIVLEITTIFWSKVGYVDNIVMLRAQIPNLFYINNPVRFAIAEGRKHKNYSLLASTPTNHTYSGYMMIYGSAVSSHKWFGIFEIVREFLVVGIPMIAITILSYVIIVAHRNYLRKKSKMKSPNQAPAIKTTLEEVSNTDAPMQTVKTLVKAVNENKNNVKMNKDEMRATLLQIITVIQFMICEVPQGIVTAIFSIFNCPSLENLDCKFRQWLTFSNVMQLSNHCISFYVLVLFNENFRKTFCNLWAIRKISE